MVIFGTDRSLRSKTSDSMKFRCDLLYKRKCVHAKLTALAGRDWARVTVSEVPQIGFGGRGEVQLQHKLIDRGRATNCQATCGHARWR